MSTPCHSRASALPMSPHEVRCWDCLYRAEQMGLREEPRSCPKPHSHLAGNDPAESGFEYHILKPPAWLLYLEVSGLCNPDVVGLLNAPVNGAGPSHTASALPTAASPSAGRKPVQVEPVAGHIQAHAELEQKGGPWVQ